VSAAKRHRLARAALALLAASSVVALGACGISAEGSANRIEPAEVPFGLLDAEPTTTVAETGRPATVYLLADNRLVAVERTLPANDELGDLLALVQAGPSEVERSLGVTSSVPAGTVASVDQSRGVARVDLTTAFGDVRGGEQLLALGQIVYTLTGQPGIGGVELSLEGDAVELPLADGSVTDRPLTRDDFAALAPV